MYVLSLFDYNCQCTSNAFSFRSCLFCLLALVPLPIPPSISPPPSPIFSFVPLPLPSYPPSSTQCPPQLFSPIDTCIRAFFKSGHHWNRIFIFVIEHQDSFPNQNTYLSFLNSKNSSRLSKYFHFYKHLYMIIHHKLWCRTENQFPFFTSYRMNGITRFVIIFQPYHRDYLTAKYFIFIAKNYKIIAFLKVEIL